MTEAIRLFISHCAEDADLAGRLVELIRAALNLPASAIRCTSVDGYRLPGGADTDEELRREVYEAQAFLGIVSANSMRSMYVLFELGARWGAGKHLLPLLAPGTPADVLSGPIASLNALRADSSAQLLQLVSDLADVLSLSPESAASYQRFVDRVLQVPPSQAASPATGTHSPAPVQGLSQEAKAILMTLPDEDEIMAEDLAQAVGLSEAKTRYFLDRLCEQELVYRLEYSGRPPGYVRRDKGRKYLFEAGLLK